MILHWALTAADLAIVAALCRYIATYERRIK